MNKQLSGALLLVISLLTFSNYHLIKSRLPVFESIVNEVLTSKSNLAQVSTNVFQPTSSVSSFAVGNWIRTTAKLNIRSEPSSSSRRIGSQNSGSVGRIINGPMFSEGYTWWNIDFNSGADGWAVESFMVPIESPAPIDVGSTVEAVERVNVRSEPSTSGRNVVGRQNAGSIGIVKSGPTVASGYTWWNIDFNSGADGWVAGDFLFVLNQNNPTPPPSPEPSPTLSFSATPSTITSGQSSTLSWSAINATSCTASGGWSGTKSISGTQIVSPSSNTSYTLTCVGTGGSVNQSVSVVVNVQTTTPNPSSNTLNLTLRRHDGGSGAVLINHAIPLRRGMIPANYNMNQITVRIDGAEVPLYAEALQGTWPDGSARGVLLQYETTLSSTQTRNAVLNIGETRSLASRSKTVYTPFNGIPRASGLPTDPNYLVQTEYHSARGIDLVPTNSIVSPTPFINQMESDYVQWSNYHANQSYYNDWHQGATASYDRAYTAYQHWLRTGNPTWWERAVRIAHLYRIQYIDPSTAGPAVWHGQPESVEMYYRATGDSRVLERILQTQPNDGTGVAYAHKTFWGLAFHERQGTSWGGMHTPGREPRPKARAMLATVNSHRIGFVNPPVQYANDVSTQLGYLRQGMVRSGEWPRFDACGDPIAQTGAVENFQIGMLMTSAIEADAYLGGDTRAREIVAQSLEYLWQNSWDSNIRAFKYSPIQCSSAPGGGLGTTPYGDLNMFFAFAAYWHAYETNSQLWFDRAELIMQGANSARSSLIYSKQFDQLYYRYADALAYRQAYLNNR